MISGVIFYKNEKTELSALLVTALKCLTKRNRSCSRRAGSSWVLFYPSYHTAYTWKEPTPWLGQTTKRYNGAWPCPMKTEKWRPGVWGSQNSSLTSSIALWWKAEQLTGCGVSKTNLRTKLSRMMMCQSSSDLKKFSQVDHTEKNPTSISIWNLGPYIFLLFSTQPESRLQRLYKCGDSDRWLKLFLCISPTTTVTPLLRPSKNVAFN